MKLKRLLMGVVLAHFSALGGCVSFYSCRTDSISVNDAESGAPVPDARVQVRYSHYLGSLNWPKPATVVTDASGKAAMLVATYHPRTWEIAAAGYLTEHAPDPDHSFRMYREPEPHVSVFIPDGCRGPVKLEHLGSEPNAYAPGTRQFVFRSSGDGYAQITAVPLVRRV